MRLSYKFILSLFVVFLYAENSLFAQACTTLGQTPSTAFPVCGTTVFTQASVPLCATNSLFVPGCSGDGANYENRNPFFYRFTCFVSGTLGFLITPLAANEDYDWQLYDITGRDPNEIFTNNSLVVTGNWAGTYGPTGASASGVPGIQCASDPTAGANTFATMPNLVQGHEYLLLISHFTNTQSGYNLSFGGGTAVITDPTEPHLQSAKPDCDGTKITVKLNKKVRCNSITLTGTEFSLLPAVTTVVAAVPDSCAFAFDFDEITLTLAAPLTNGNYQLVINNGTDANTLLDNCARAIPQNEQVPFTYAVPQPIFADSIGRVGCASDSIKIYFPKKISCASIAANGSDFSVSGPAPLTILSASGNCVDGKTEYVVVKFTTPVYTGGTYQLSLKAGNDGTILVDECGQEMPIQTLPFITADTVNASFTYTAVYGCQRDTFLFSHNGAHNVNSWNWTINTITATTQNHTIIFPATSTNDIQLIVSNGVCKDTATTQVVLSNEVKASFTMPDIICPEDPLEVVNTSTGQISSWLWKYDVVGSSTVKDPPPFLFPTINREAYYTVKLLAYNSSLGCADSARKTLTVLDHCLIEVPSGFTPNNDGLNDFFQPHNALKADNYEFKVYNRWGQLVFQSRNWREKWDGKINGAYQTTGVFVWMLSYTHRDTGKQVFRKGTVTLIR
ncbi:MAG TPA: gliding motility-associated C-terminal domain-containing protein [Chitinophagaceae bacterium]|nr:gliding motility-associated C-terminal domain-containing protein [Chitinophagaceae bacterium]HQZ74832.1 gliding motility-associated C-terminal domain-containing protein [Chitinophagaceae bacterium]